MSTYYGMRSEHRVNGEADLYPTYYTIAGSAGTTGEELTMATDAKALFDHMLTKLTTFYHAAEFAYPVTITRGDGFVEVTWARLFEEPFEGFGENHNVTWEIYPISAAEAGGTDVWDFAAGTSHTAPLIFDYWAEFTDVGNPFGPDVVLSNPTGAEVAALLATRGDLDVRLAWRIDKGDDEPWELGRSDSRERLTLATFDGVFDLSQWAESELGASNGRPE